jgi:hypothetical protein
MGRFSSGLVFLFLLLRGQYHLPINLTEHKIHST